MTIKTAFLAGAAAVLMTSAPALAQDVPAAATPAPAAQPQSLTLTPGATVRGSDGAEIGKLVGAQNNASGEQELTVRGADGQVRAVPLPGIRQEGSDVVVGWSTAEYQAAPAVSGETAPAAPAASSAAPAQPSASDSTMPATPAVPDTAGPDAAEPAASPDASTVPEPTTPQ
ncbi:superoxide dismutase [Brevundimonas sp. PAMC22021]|uniref:superoxide dismutase n=1 Tax=Brevundimonas sp. PAMC22021 TaxID=2861285 RepID=UPI001C62759D|nr:superoxide dismutase [Brevundimonas sp. PAMC22021]QYF86922.1 superoxide dismutase [Brevundimonas sp. PAMC22021]